MRVYQHKTASNMQCQYNAMPRQGHAKTVNMLICHGKTASKMICEDKTVCIRHE